MHLIQLLLPLHDNEGRAFSPDYFTLQQVLKQLRPKAIPAVDRCEKGSTHRAARMRAKSASQD